MAIQNATIKPRRLVPIGVGVCISFLGSNRDAPCENCGQPSLRHSEPILYIFDQHLFETSNDIGVVCERCWGVYAANYDECPDYFSAHAAIVTR